MKKWKEELRELKIDVVSGERKTEVSKDAMDRFAAELRFIAKEFPDDIITGSLALNLYGFIDRPITDVDIIIDSRFRYTGYKSGQLYGSYNDGELDMSNRLGSINFKDEVSPGAIKRFLGMKSYITRKVDFFEMTATTRFETFSFEGHQYRIQDAVDIVECKCHIEINCKGGGHMTQRQKHGTDLMKIFKIEHNLIEYPF